MPGGPTMLQTITSAFCVALSFMGGVAKVRFLPSSDIHKETVSGLAGWEWPCGGEKAAPSRYNDWYFPYSSDAPPTSCCDFAPRGNCISNSSSHGPARTSRHCSRHRSQGQQGSRWRHFHVEGRIPPNSCLGPRCSGMEPSWRLGGNIHPA